MTACRWGGRHMLCVSALLVGVQASSLIASSSDDDPPPLENNTTSSTVDDEQSRSWTSKLGAPHRLNCGGGAFVDSEGREWSSDAGYVVPSTAERDAKDDATYDIAGLTSQDARLLYGKRRFAARGDGRSVAYELPVERAGLYEVRLHFVEFSPRAAEPGGRVFDVLIQGRLRNTVDLGAAVGLRHLLLKRYAVTVQEPHGVVMIELLGVVRNPIVSAIEVLGPTTSLPDFGDNVTQGDNDDSEAVSIENAEERAAVFEPPMQAESITNDASGSVYRLSYVATGGRHRDDVQFASASASHAFLYRIDTTDDVSTLRAFELRCAAHCDADTLCAGFFVRVVLHAMYCAGVPSVSEYVATNTLTRSWARDLQSSVPGGDSSGNSFAPQNDVLSRIDLGFNGDEADGFFVAFEGRTAEHPSGPWLTFSTALRRSEHAFGPMDATLRGCANHCRYVRTCVGFVMMADPDEGKAHMHCVGLSALGFRRGSETQLASLSFVKVSPGVGARDGEPITTTASPTTTHGRTAIDSNEGGDGGDAPHAGSSGGKGVDTDDKTIADVTAFTSSGGGGDSGGHGGIIGGISALLVVAVGVAVAVGVWRRRSRRYNLKRSVQRRGTAQILLRPSIDAVTLDWDVTSTGRLSWAAATGVPALKRREHISATPVGAAKLGHIRSTAGGLADRLNNLTSRLSRFSSSLIAEADGYQPTSGDTPPGAVATATESHGQRVPKLMMREVDRTGSRMQTSINRRSTARRETRGRSSLSHRQSTGGESGIIYMEIEDIHRSEHTHEA